MKAWFFCSKISYLPTLLAWFYCPPLHAAMYVYPMETTVSETGASQIRVISQDNDVQFIKIKLKQIINPATDNEREIDSDMSDASQLIVTPQKIALSAGGERLVRLVSLNPPQKETTWRVYFEGVNEDVYNLSNQKNRNIIGEANVGVNIIWGALVHVAPQKVNASLVYNFSTGKVINNGTIRIPVKEVGVCNSFSECKWEKKELTFYPGSALPIDGIKIFPSMTYKIKYFNWIKNTTEVMELPVSQAPAPLP